MFFSYFCQMKSFFKPTFYSFLKELAANNHKEWMDANKKSYQNDVKIPFENFITALIQEVSSFDEPIEIKSNDAIFRINKDIRFSADKTPYKTNRTAIISKFGRKDKVYPGYYFFASPEKVMLGGGAYFLEKENLFKVRQEIAYNLQEFDAIINEKSFQQNFPEILGEKNKVIPAEFKEDATTQPLLANKGFYFMKEFPAELLYSEDLLPVVAEVYKTAKPFNDFMRRALV